MVRRRVVVEELQRVYKTDAEPGGSEEWVTTAELTTGSSKAIGGFLRALADEIDPPERHYS